MNTPQKIIPMNNPQINTIHKPFIQPQNSPQPLNGPQVIQGLNQPQMVPNQPQNAPNQPQFAPQPLKGPNQTQIASQPLNGPNQPIKGPNQTQNYPNQPQLASQPLNGPNQTQIASQHLNGLSPQKAPQFQIEKQELNQELLKKCKEELKVILQEHKSRVVERKQKANQIKNGIQEQVKECQAEGIN